MKKNASKLINLGRTVFSLAGWVNPDGSVFEELWAWEKKLLTLHDTAVHVFSIQFQLCFLDLAYFVVKNSLCL